VGEPESSATLSKRESSESSFKRE